MSRAARPLPPVAPRGARYVVTYLSHVTGRDVAVRTHDCGRQLDAALHYAGRIDWRLNPRVDLERA